MNPTIPPVNNMNPNSAAVAAYLSGGFTNLDNVFKPVYIFSHYPCDIRHEERGVVQMINGQPVTRLVNYVLPGVESREQVSCMRMDPILTSMRHLPKDADVNDFETGKLWNEHPPEHRQISAQQAADQFIALHVSSKFTAAGNTGAIGVFTVTSDELPAKFGNLMSGVDSKVFDITDFADYPDLHKKIMDYRQRQLILSQWMVTLCSTYHNEKHDKMIGIEHRAIVKWGLGIEKASTYPWFGPRGYTESKFCFMCGTSINYTALACNSCGRNLLDEAMKMQNNGMLMLVTDPFILEKLTVLGQGNVTQTSTREEGIAALKHEPSIFVQAPPSQGNKPNAMSKLAGKI